MDPIITEISCEGFSFHFHFHRDSEIKNEFNFKNGQSSCINIYDNIHQRNACDSKRPCNYLCHQYLNAEGCLNINLYGNLVLFPSCFFFFPFDREKVFQMKLSLHAKGLEKNSKYSQKIL